MLTSETVMHGKQKRTVFAVLCLDTRFVDLSQSVLKNLPMFQLQQDVEYLHDQSMAILCDVDPLQVVQDSSRRTTSATSELQSASWTKMTF